ncbi:hypothetical protein QE152_g216 [Popillia japonica]|uniref:Reverse transcriptase domain-containing protein n=1 Tax=Popillia japonica TaxID=7064 RepID=A0AAW1NKE0_POPJA
MTPTRTNSQIRIDGQVMKNIARNRSVRGGNPLSTVLLNLILEAILRKTWGRHGDQLNNLSTALSDQFAYSDDLTMNTRSRRELKAVFDKLNNTPKG